MRVITSLFSVALFASACHGDNDNLVGASLSQPIVFLGSEYSGEACPPGSITVGKVDFPNGVFEVHYQNLSISIDGSQGQTNLQKACQLKVKFGTTSDTQIVVERAEFLGLVDADDHVYAKEENLYSFEGYSGVSDASWEFWGPNHNYTSFTNYLNETLISPCGSNGSVFNLIVDNVLTLKSYGFGKGSIGVSELDSSIVQSLGIRATNCFEHPTSPINFAKIN